jgi:hypothetical protein
MQLVNTDNPDLKRDPVTGALLNTNNAGLQKYRQERENRQLIREMQNDIQDTKNELREIKDLLLKNLREN